MFICVDYKSSIDIHPLNTRSDFYYQLPEIIENGDMYELGICQIRLNYTLSKVMYLYCDIVEQSIVFGKRAPLLGVFKARHSKAAPVFVNICKSRIAYIHFYIKLADGSNPSSSDLNKLSSLVLVLTMQRRRDVVQPNQHTVMI